MTLQCVSAVEFLDIYNALITQSFRMPSPLENTVSKTMGKQDCKQDFLIVITHTTDFLSMPVLVVIIMWSTIFTFTDAICLHLMLE